MIKKVKNTVLWTYVINDLHRVRKLLECFMEKNCKGQIKESLELKK